MRIKDNMHSFQLDKSIYRQPTKSAYVQLMARLRFIYPSLNFIEKLAYKTSFGDPTFEYLRTKVFRRFGEIAYEHGFHPNLISMIGCSFALLGAFLINYPLIASLFVMSSLILDGLDGVVARVNDEKLGKRIINGSLVDLTCDTIGVVALQISLIHFEYINKWLGAFSVLLTIVYVLLCANKNGLLINQFKSVGNRVICGIGFSVIFFFLGLNIVGEDTSKLFLQNLFLFIDVFLLIGTFEIVFNQFRFKTLKPTQQEVIQYITQK